jgi:hypothetical protein
MCEHEGTGLTEVVSRTRDPLDVLRTHYSGELAKSGMRLCVATEVLLEKKGAWCLLSHALHLFVLCGAVQSGGRFAFRCHNCPRVHRT